MKEFLFYFNAILFNKYKIIIYLCSDEYIFMRVGANIKGGIISIFVIGIIIGGIIMFIGLSRDKQVLTTQLYSYVPLDISSVLQINKEKDINKLLPYLKSLDNVVLKLKSSVSYPLLFAQKGSSLYMLARITDDQKKVIRNLMDTDIFSHYPPKQKNYKGEEILFYVTEDNHFFVCMFYKDIFVGGYDLQLLEDIIDIHQKQSPAIATTSMGKEAIRQIKGHYPANLFVNNNSSFSVLNIDFDESGIEMKGYDTGIFTDEWTCDEYDSDYLEIDFPVFPNKLIAYRADWKNPLINDSLKCYFSPPSYTFYLDESLQEVHALKHIRDKYSVYNMLNDLEEQYIQKRFDTHDYSHGYRVYTTSGQMGKEVFNTDGVVFMTFINHCLVFSKDRKSLEGYLANNGNYISEENPFEYMDLDSDIISLFYTDDISKQSSELFNSKNPLVTDEKAYIFSSLGNKKMEFEVHIER